MQGHHIVVPALDAPKVVESLRSHPDGTKLFMLFQQQVQLLQLLQLI